MATVSQGSSVKKVTAVRIHSEDVGEQDRAEAPQCIEDEVRATAAHTMHVETLCHPTEPSISTAHWVFCRQLSVSMFNYWEYTAWAKEQQRSVAGSSMFLRAFNRCHMVLRVRKVGDHAICHTCRDFKEQLRKARFPKERQLILGQCTAHIRNQ
jgi:hypothetical protein